MKLLVFLVAAAFLCSLALVSASGTGGVAILTDDASKCSVMVSNGGKTAIVVNGNESKLEVSGLEATADAVKSYVKALGCAEGNFTGSNAITDENLTIKS